MSEARPVLKQRDSAVGQPKVVLKQRDSAVGQPKSMAQMWRKVAVRFLPFADAASADLPLGRLLRLALFQITVGMGVVLLTGTLNRVMIVEMGVPAWLVALMVALPLVTAPFRAFIGHRSDGRRSAIGWRRVPYLWYGTMLQFGGLAIMPFALIVLSEPHNGPEWLGPAAAALAFLMAGAGLHVAQTAGLALAGDLAPKETRPKVVALLYVMLLVGMGGSALVFGLLLTDYTAERLIQVVQGAAFFTVVVNLIALWKQEARRPNKHAAAPIAFRAAWAKYTGNRRTTRLLAAVGLGAAGFSMQDVLLEPYGAEILGLSVSGTTMLTAIMAAGALAGFAYAARALTGGRDSCRLAAMGALAGIAAFSCVILAPAFGAEWLFRLGVVGIGFGGGLFAVGTLTAAMDMAETSDNGLALGAWGAVQASAAGAGLAIGGALRDGFSAMAATGVFGPALTGPEAGYGFVYHLEIALLFAALVAIGPLAQPRRDATLAGREKFGLADLPG